MRLVNKFGNQLNNFDWMVGKLLVFEESKMAVKFPPDNGLGGNKMNTSKMSQMFNGNKLFDRMFRKADGVVWDLIIVQ